MINFHPLDVVDRGSETQLQMGENLNKLSSRIKAKTNISFCNIADMLVAKGFHQLYGILIYSTFPKLS